MQKVELAFPVEPHDKDVDVIRLHIPNLLFTTTLRNDLVHITNGLQNVLSMFVLIVGFFVLLRVKLVSREPNNQPVTQLGGALKQVDVSPVE